MFWTYITLHVLRRQRGREVRVPDFESGGHRFKSCPDHLHVAGVVSWQNLVQVVSHIYKKPTGLQSASWDS